MAVRLFPSPPIIIHKPCPTKKPISRVLMISQSYISIQRQPLVQIRSSLKNKVFEDQSRGIVCYRDANGEITCEGYDEGPRLDQEITRINCSNPRDDEIIDLLQSWLQIVDGGEINHADKDVAVAKDFHSNGFNSFC